MRTLTAELVDLEFTGTPPTVRRNGTDLLLGGAHGQFAHFSTERLSRLWALVLFPDLPVVVYEPALADWQSELLAAAGVSRDRIVHVIRRPPSSVWSCRAGRFHLHRGASPRMNATRDRIADGFAGGAPNPASTCPAPALGSAARFRTKPPSRRD